MIACHEKFLMPVWRREDCALRVIGATGEKLQGEKRVGCSAFAQVDFDRIPFPVCVCVLACYDKIECEPPDDSGLAQKIAHLCCIPSDRRSISWIGRENAAEITLTAWSGEHLVVS